MHPRFSVFARQRTPSFTLSLKSAFISAMRMESCDPTSTDLLAVIDSGPFEAKYTSAASNLARAKADIGLRHATVAEAKHLFAQYERDAGRYRIRAPSGSASRTS